MNGPLNKTGNEEDFISEGGSQVKNLDEKKPDSMSAALVRLLRAVILMST